MDDWIVVPSNNDVLLGRGVKYHDHPGNARFNGRFLHDPWSCGSLKVYANVFHAYTELVEKNRDCYNAAKEASKKRAILKGIVSIILEKGRFLKNHMGFWTTITAEQALLKTAHAIQYQMRKERIGVMGQQTLKSQGNNDSPTILQRSTVDDLATENSQKTLELYCQWMVRANEQFWARLGPDARNRLPRDMIAAVPLNPKSGACVAARLQEDHVKL
jgi:hypothetical protein